MDDHVFRAKRGQPVAQINRTADQRCRIGPCAGSERQDRVMHVDHPVARFVDQRWQLMHMVAVISVVIGVLLHPFPTGRKERRFGLVHAVARYKNVEIPHETPSARVHARRKVSCALQKEYGQPNWCQRLPRHLCLPQRLSPVGFRRTSGTVEHARRRYRHIKPCQAMRKRPQEALGLRDGQHRRPLMGAQLRRAGRVGQHPGEDAGIPHVSSAQSSSTSANAVFVSG